MHVNLHRFECMPPSLGIADPQRLPSLNYRASEFADKGYAVTDIDALTGAQRFHNIRFDDSGQVFNLNPADVTPELRAMLTLTGAPNYPQLNAYMLNSALQRQAIAPLWEVKTARMQETAGDPNAGVTEEERAAKAGLGAAVDTAYVQSHPNDVNASNKRIGRFMPIGIDLGAQPESVIMQDGFIKHYQNNSYSRIFDERSRAFSSRQPPQDSTNGGFWLVAA